MQSVVVRSTTTSVLLYLMAYWRGFTFIVAQTKRVPFHSFHAFFSGLVGSAWPFSKQRDKIERGHKAGPGTTPSHWIKGGNHAVTDPSKFHGARLTMAFPGRVWTCLSPYTAPLPATSFTCHTGSVVSGDL